MIALLSDNGLAAITAVCTTIIIGIVVWKLLD